VKPPRRPRPGDRISAEGRRARDAAARSAAPGAGDGRAIGRTRSGTRVAIPGGGLDGFWAKLGAHAGGGQYPFAEQVLTPDGGAGTWADRPSGRSGACWEVLGRTYLAGKVVWIPVPPAGTSHRFRFNVRGGCAGTVKVRLTREQDDTPITGATAAVYAYPVNGDPKYLVASGTLDPGTGTLTTPAFPMGEKYEIDFAVPSQWGMTASFAVKPDRFSRYCAEVRDFAFCEARLTIHNNVAGLQRFGTYVDTSYLTTGYFRASYEQGTIGLDGRFAAGACPMPPRVTLGYDYEASLYTFGLGTVTPPLGGDPGISGSDYTTTHFRLRERPYSCPPDAWQWTVRKQGAQPLDYCNMDGRYKDQCGVLAAACGAADDATSVQFAYGTDWSEFRGTCDDRCGTGCDGSNVGHNTGNDPGGLLKTALVATFIAPNELGCMANVAPGTEVDLACTGSPSAGVQRYEGSAGGAVLTVDFGAGGCVGWTCGALDGYGNPCTAGGPGGGDICHPTLITLSDPSGLHGANCWLVTE
jgi:hypothetical protein